MGVETAAGLDTAKVHLHVLGQKREISFQVRVGACTVSDLLPSARELSHAITALSIAQTEAEGRAVTCREGCAACCRHLIGISSVEALSLGELVAALPPEPRAELRRRFAAAVAQMEDAGLLDPSAPPGRTALLSRAAPDESSWEHVSRRYFEAQIACPFLEDERCSVYAERPLVCREYNVTTPAASCSTLSGEVHATERPVRMDEALASAAGEIAGVDEKLIPLPLLLEWVEAHGDALRQTTGDGEEMFWVLLRHVDTEIQTPFEER
jgi:Fe-S-cluster containining protein